MVDNVSNLESGNRQKIEKYLVSQKSGATINQIAEGTELSWLTIQRHLDYLESIGRIHKIQAGKFDIYSLNGVGKWQKEINLNTKHKLYLDTFMTSFDKPFIRIKEVKKKEDNSWKTFGEIMITEDKLNDVIDFLEKIKKDLPKYKE